MLRSFLKSSLGRLAFIFLALTTVFLAVSVVSKWNELRDDLELELRNVHELLMRSVVDRFDQQEAIFQLIGQRILELDPVERPLQVVKIFRESKASMPFYLGYRITSPDGRVLVTSRGIAGNSEVNMLEAGSTRGSFLTALNSKHLVVGRTYFNKSLQQWIVPLRYAVRDSSGEVAFVLSAAMDLEREFGPWHSRGVGNDINVLVNIREAESGLFYPVFYKHFSEFGATRADVYDKPLPAAFVNTVIERMEDATGEPFESLLEHDFKASFISDAPGLDPALGVSGLNAQHQFFLGIRQTLPNLGEEFLGTLAIYLLIYCLVSGLILLLMYRMFRADRLHQREMRHMALHDSLTNLPNRNYLSTNFERWIATAGYPYALLLIDLDNFKFINDHFGHAIGDEVLRKTAARLEQAAPDDSLLLRQGGDEFMLLMPFADLAACNEKLQQLTDCINTTMVLDDKPTTVSGSIGVTLCTGPNSSLDKQIVEADIAMYEAKKVRNAHAFFTDDMQHKIDQRAVLESALRAALETDELTLVYQPLVDARSGQIVGAEALCRWHSKTLGQVTPDLFIPVAEGCGLMNVLGACVINTAFGEMAPILKAVPGFRLSINVSVQQLINSGFRTHLNTAAERHDFDKSCVCVEITESVFMEESWNIGDMLKLIHDDGFIISLDDFGTGYSSLSVLRSLPIREIKIDKSFVKDIFDDRQDRALIRSIISIGKSLEIPTLAEGVETLDQALLLREYGCDLFQGYLFARPLPIVELTAFIDSPPKLELEGQSSWQTEEKETKRWFRT